MFFVFNNREMILVNSNQTDPISPSITKIEFMTATQACKGSYLDQKVIGGA